MQHGFLSSALEWQHQFAVFTEDFDIIAPDLPGFGGSASVHAPRTIDGFAAEVIGLLDALDVSRFSLVGHWMGGAIAQEIAVAHSGRVEKLVLYGTSCSGALPERFETFTESIARLRREGTSSHADRVVPTWFRSGARHANYALSRRAAEDMSLQAAIAGQEAMSCWDMSDQIKAIACPTLVMCGDHDASCSPNESYRLWKAIPGAQLCIVPDCAHNVHLERPDLFNLILRDFVV